MTKQLSPLSTQDTEAWSNTLQASLADANIPTLLMVLVHLTASEQWLSQRYQCTKVRGIDDHDTGGLEPEIQQEVRDAAHQAILAWKEGRTPKLEQASAQLVQDMLSVSIGEAFPRSYSDMVAAGLGLDSEFDLDQKAQFQLPPGFQVVVIGAGVAGICSAIRLMQSGIPFFVIEKNNEVGGTWHENRYPGCGVDTPNHIYSFSFSKHDWSRYFALQAEIQSYFEQVATDFGIRKHIRFNTKVLAARYDEQHAHWNVDIESSAGENQTLRANLLLSAVGLLNVPRMPDIQGLQSFKGRCVHTARWPEDLDVTGKRVAVIGNGASAMQVVPAIVDQVAHLTIFQRSKQWAAPFAKFKKQVPDSVRFLLREVPFYQEWYRQRLSWIFNDRIHHSLQKDPEWPHPERAINKYNDRQRIHFTDYIKEQLGQRQDLLNDVLPDYPPFGKRMLMDNGWFRTVARDDVTLVTGGISRITERGIVTDKGGEHEVDVIIIATGFDALNMLGSFTLQGRGGQTIREAWAEKGAQAFYGVAMPGFPNFFAFAGPNTALGHGGSVVALLEAQVRYVMGLVKKALKECNGTFELEVKRDAHDEYNQRIQDAHDRMIWTHKGMSNWYRNAQGRVVATTPFRNDDYWSWLRATDLAHYHLKPATSQSARSTTSSDEVTV
ncbi:MULTISPECIES: flavin-containing monooxygenase [Comamonas]|uniref:flavin-containing monooxygenase n=1 Tax=Comamonas TaxID=283 RepID=UPI00051075DF|nr:MULTISPECIES: NAD(P)/FAD-dependent oxidoreductase [Comamonas]KGG85022.1 monooxygenase [Comamonas thiooxydans]KGG95162.1 monooxygenase [Comamonas thiooxydans]KGG96774.1 monooxygenase [Comamonas thiooxydans]KGH06144.1 monooxygenase [Comamonas thiooxydans]TZG08197.1 NAD(P)/FAD-dependent oxidoreductase [Comamonas thiooxydans]